MKFRLVVLISCCLVSQFSSAQTTDSTRVLDELVVKAYRTDRPLLEVPASVSLVTSPDKVRFSNTSLVPVVNMVPGVRMEERSPGSYRFSIRGSLLRSPFGVRNVKFYWSGLPLTDAGGNTYLNLLDFDAVGNMEIIKGPGASLYGAGTGGVVLLQSPAENPQRSSSQSVVGGSYGMLRAQAEVVSRPDQSVQWSTRASYQRADGYRAHTEMERLAFGGDATFAIDPRNIIVATLLAGRLQYETPGGLTLAQFQANPRQARPPTATLPGAEDQKASVTNNTLFAGLRWEHDWSNRAKTNIGFVSSFTDFQNPTIRNFEERRETNWGGRTETQWLLGTQQNGKLTVGGEFQSLASPVRVFANSGGVKGNELEYDELASTTALTFAQLEWSFSKKWFATVGASANFLRCEFERVSVTPVVVQERKFSPRVFPRAAVLAKLNAFHSLFATMSEGFSPPTLAEVRPSTGNFNNALSPERGINYEVGWRLHWQGIRLELAGYQFRLRDAIVIQRAADGAEFFVNAGRTRQQGFEGSATWTLHREGRVLERLQATAHVTLSKFRFDDYVQDGNDFSGNRLTGVAPGFVATSADLTFSNGLYANSTLQYSDHVPLNDANTIFASDYWLLGSRVGYKTTVGGQQFDFFTGVDNILNEEYSLGNDLNAVGGRYFNAAPLRNFYAGVKITFAR